MNLWVATLDRERMLAVFGRRRASSTDISPYSYYTSSLPEPPSGHIGLVWARQPTLVSVPSVIVVPIGEVRDFLAWASTFLEHLRPFSAYCRVIESGSITLPEDGPAPILPERMEAALAGLIMAEALAAASGTASLRDLTPVACKSTYFFAVGRMLALGPPFDHMSNLYLGWNRLRELTRQPPRESHRGTIQQIQDTLLTLAGHSTSSTNRSIEAACEQIIHTGEISNHTWYSLTEGSESLRDAIQEMRANRERRVRLLDKVFAASHMQRESPGYLFVLGYLLSLFDGGENINVQLLPRLPSWSSILMWHGLTAGLLLENGIEGIAGGLGRRIIRDLLQQESFFEAPRADISLDELTMYLEGNRPLEDFRVGAPTSMTVELGPRISTTVRWPVRLRESSQINELATPKRDSAPGPLQPLRHREIPLPTESVVLQDETIPPSGRQRSLFDEPLPSDHRELLRMLGYHLEYARTIQQRLVSLLPDEPRRQTNRRPKK